jgi:hypothetical protein
LEIIGIKKTSKLLLKFVLVVYSDQTIESIVEEMENFLALFESTKVSIPF